MCIHNLLGNIPSYGQCYGIKFISEMDKASWEIEHPHPCYFRRLFHILLFLNYSDEEKILGPGRAFTSTFQTGVLPCFSHRQKLSHIVSFTSLSCIFSSPASTLEFLSPMIPSRMTIIFLLSFHFPWPSVFSAILLNMLLIHSSTFFCLQLLSMSSALLNTDDNIYT